jgi:hypothetical protein
MSQPLIAVQRCSRRACLALVLPVATAAFSSDLHAQAKDSAAIRAIAEAFSSAVESERWDDAASLLDLEYFEGLLRRRVEAARGQLPYLGPSVEEILADNPEMPRVVAEWQVAETRKHLARRPHTDFSHEFAGVTSFKQLSELSVRDAAARWVSARDYRTQLREARKYSDCPLPTADDSLFPPTRRQIVGIAQRDSVTAYVLTVDPHLAGADPDVDLDIGPQVMILRRTRAGWRIHPNHGTLNFVSVVGVSCGSGRK